MMYVNEKHLHSLEYVMLEVRLPREINKSPQAFEYIANALIQGGGVAKPYNIKWLGALPAMSSLEIASLEGTIHFYIRTQKKFRSIVESNLYAQYPNIEVIEADDYTKKLRYEHNKQDVSLFGTGFTLAKTFAPTNEETGKEWKKDDGKNYEMRADFVPIKTYVDYGLDKDPKEEYKNDPLIPMLEFFGSLGKDEYAWYQILIQDESPFDNKKFDATYVNEKNHKHLTLKDLAKERIKQIRTSHYVVKGEKMIDEYGDPKEKKIGKDAEGKPLMGPASYYETKAVGKKEMELTPEEKDEIETINKKISKPLARCLIRLVYISGGKFNGGNITTLMSNMKPFAGANNFRPFSVSSPYDYPWQDTFKKRVPWRTEELFNDYVERAGFHPHSGVIDSKNKIYLFEDVFFFNFKTSVRNFFHIMYETILHPFAHPDTNNICVLNTEEIATLYHFPGETATVPTLPRIDSIKGKAPTNLPL